VAGSTGGTGACGNLIDNMEADDGHICTGNGRQGFWYTYVDSEPGSSISPSTKPALPVAAIPVRANSQYAMYASGTFHSYAGLGCTLDAVLGGQIQSINASSFTGVHFWAHGDPIKVVLQTTADETTANGGTCTLVNCFGSDSTPVYGSETDWSEFHVPFTTFTGGAYPFQASDLWSIEFGPIDPGPFEFWIDDLSFY
jgi:hypothetical protein